MIPSKDIGQVLRILGQNPTEDQVVEMVMKVSNILIIVKKCMTKKLRSKIFKCKRKYG